MQASRSVAMSLYLNQREIENSHYYIKRIIALPGESVEIVENSVYINGEKLQEDYETSKIDDVGIVNRKDKIRQ